MRLDVKVSLVELRNLCIIITSVIGMAKHVAILQRQLFARSERVKGIDFHPTEPWVFVHLTLLL